MECGIPLQEASVHESSGVSLIAVADDIFRLPRAPRQLSHFWPVGIQPSPPPESGSFDLADDFFRCHLQERFGQSPVPAQGHIILDPGRVDEFIVSQEEPHLER